MLLLIKIVELITMKLFLIRKIGLLISKSDLDINSKTAQEYFYMIWLGSIGME